MRLPTKIAPVRLPFKEVNLMSSLISIAECIERVTILHEHFYVGHYFNHIGMFYFLEKHWGKNTL